MLGYEYVNATLIMFFSFYLTTFWELIYVLFHFLFHTTLFLMSVKTGRNRGRVGVIRPTTPFGENIFIV